MKLGHLDVVPLLAPSMVSFDIASGGGDELGRVDAVDGGEGACKLGIVVATVGLMTGGATTLVLVGAGGLIGGGLKVTLFPGARG